jgi:hypothetical protein
MKTLSDIQAPAVPVRKLLEKDVQKQCVDWARARGYWARKFSSQSQRSVPDFLFAKAEGDFKFACEFKAPGKKPTDAQLDEMQLMRDAGWTVFWVDSLELFKESVAHAELCAFNGDHTPGHRV